MKHGAGLDVSENKTAICIYLHRRQKGRIRLETKIISHPEELPTALTETGLRIEWIGLEAGAMSSWLFEGMARTGLPVICVEMCHSKAFLWAQVNKMDRNDARRIAQMLGANL